MADNYVATQGSGTTFGADDVGGVLFPRVKIQIGADGERADVDGGQQTMANSVPVVLASNQSGVPVAALEAGTPTEYNITLTNANTEYGQALPANTLRLAVRCRSGAQVRYAWTTGKVATPTAPYQTLQAGAEYVLEGVKLASATLYLASAAAGSIVEMEAWA